MNKSLSRARLLIPTLWRLGPLSVLRVLGYRLKVRWGYYRLCLPIRAFEAKAACFTPSFTTRRVTSSEHSKLLDSAIRIKSGRWTFFERHEFELGPIPDWNLHPFSKAKFSSPHLHWSQLEDFDPKLGDIKAIWELSRMGWMIRLAQAYRLTGDDGWLSLMNQLLNDWLLKNPFNAGPQWKCGQEASLRALHLVSAHEVTGDHEPSDAFVEVLRRHAERIEPSLGYAEAQKNNHALSEAVGLYVIGAFVSAHRRDNAFARWERIGRARLETCARNLFENDGTFSQYSVVYHRLALDLLSTAYRWSLKRSASLSPRTLERARAATRWLHRLVDAANGEAPNLGANDGAHILKFDASPTRDFRPSVELASQLFFKKSAFGAGSWQEPLLWTECGIASDRLEPSPSHFAGGGLYVLSSDRSQLMFRAPRFRFRPSQCDIFHVDLWIDHKNVLRDGGSYSYESKEWHPYFMGLESHNAVEVDGLSPLPFLSRFLLGAWPRVRILKADANEVAAEFTDYRGIRYRRSIQKMPSQWVILDEVENVKESALLRWRLLPAPRPQLEGNRVRQQGIEISVETADSRQQTRLNEEHWESLHYMERTPVTALETHAGGPRIRWKTSISY